MAKFLNTDLLNEWIPRLIEETERELVIAVPYIKASEGIYKYLKEANDRGIETTLIYRENKLLPAEKKKLMEISNLNLLHHPNLHAKCYYNEKYLIIGSMNLYEYSALNNREMAVLLHRVEVDGTRGKFNRSGRDSDDIFEDAIVEIKHIINGAHMEKQSRETITEGFEMEIIKTAQEKAEDYCRQVNKVFLNKKFQPLKKEDRWDSICKNYADKVDVTFNYRIEIVFNRDDVWRNKLYERAKADYDEFKFEGFKFYWNPNNKMVTLYRNNKHSIWEQSNEIEALQFTKQKIDEAMSYLRSYM